MVVIWNKALNCCKAISQMTSADQGFIAYYKNDVVDEAAEKGEDGEGYYFVDEDRGIPMGNRLVFCPFCGMQINSK